MNVTICIPTFNRPESLARVLQHLCAFASVPDEIVVGDNSGKGSAAAVVDAFRDKFKTVVYINRLANIGAMRNIDAVARVGTCPYVYILSDDDFVYENALISMKGILDNKPNVIAVNGRYDGTRHGVIGLNCDLSNLAGSLIPKGGYELLWNHLEATDNLPMMRRRDFALHTQFREMSCGVAPVVFDLLGHGDFIHLTLSVLQHEQRADSISSRIATQEVTDMANGDLEVVSCKAHLLGYDGGTVRGRVVRNVYFQGARVLLSARMYLAGWHSLTRCHAYFGLGVQTKVWLEKNILPKVVVERIVQIAADTGCTVITGQTPDINAVWLSGLNQLLDQHSHRVSKDGTVARQLVLITTHDISPQSPAQVMVSIPSLTAQFVLSGCEIKVDASGESLRMESSNPAWVDTDSTDDLQILALRTPYA